MADLQMLMAAELKVHLKRRSALCCYFDFRFWVRSVRTRINEFRNN